MESIIAILCIVFFAVLTYGLVQGRNLTKDHQYDCRTLYIPEEIDLELAYKSINNNNINYLKKRASELGASREFLDKFKEKDAPYLEIKKYIILNSVSDEHILFKKVDKSIEAREKSRVGKRIDSELKDINELQNEEKSLGIKNTKGKGLVERRKLVKKMMLEQVSGIKGMKDPKVTIKELRKDAGMDNY